MKQALINISIERTSTNVNANLPVVLFHGNDFLSGYAQSLKGLIPQNVNYIGSTNEINSGNVKFRFQDINTLGYDNLILSCNELPMTTLIQNSITKSFKIKSLGYQINDTSLIPYQNLLNIQFFKSDIFGKTIRDSFTPNQYRNDTDKLTDFIEIPLNYEINSNFGINTFLTKKNVITVNYSLVIEQI